MSILGRIVQRASDRSHHPATRPSQAASRRSYILLAIGGIVALAVSIFVWQRDRREAEIEAHYGRALDHFGAQIERRYRNYRKIVDTVTMMEHASIPPEARMLEQAADVRAKAAEAAHDEAQSLFEVLDGLKDRMESEAPIFPKLDQEAHRELAKAAAAWNKQPQTTRRRMLESKRTEAALQASEIVAELWNYAKNAAAHAHKAAKATVRARRAELAPDVAKASPKLTDSSTAKDSAYHEEAANDELDAALKEVESLPPSRSSRIENDAVARVIDHVKARREETTNADASAMASDSTYEAQLRFARSAKRSAIATAWVAKRVEELWAESLTRGQVPDLLRRAARVLRDVERPKSAQDSLDASLLVDTTLGEERPAGEGSNDRPNDANPAPASMAHEDQDLVAVQWTRLLPSHQPFLDQCLWRTEGDAKATRRCVVRKIARDIDVAERGLEITACPEQREAQPSRARLIDGGRSLVFLPPSHVSASAHPPCATLSLADLAESPSDRVDDAPTSHVELAFDEMLMLDGTGTALHSTRHGSLGIRALPELVGDTSQVKRDVELATGHYRIFVRPLDIRMARSTSADGEDRVDADGERTRHAQLVVAGLIREATLDSASLRVRPGLYVWAVLLVAFGLLALPLAKLWHAGPKARFGWRDVVFLAVSGGLATLVTVVVALGLMAHIRLSERLDSQLDTVAQRIQNRLSLELASAGTLLDQFLEGSQHVREEIATSDSSRGAQWQRIEDACTQGLTKPCSDAESYTTHPGHVMLHAFEARGDSRPVCEITDARLSHEKREPTSEWLLAYWMNRDGQQQLKVSPPNVATSPPVALKSRRYFRDALEERTFPLNSAVEGCSRKEKSAQIVRSVTSGRIVLVVATPTCDAGEETAAKSRTTTSPDETTGVAALATSLSAFQAPVLPLGFQMAVIDPQGHVVLHSSNDAHHGGNLFDDVDDPTDLRAVATSRTANAVSLQYQGAQRRAHVRPVPNTDWSVVVLGPRSVVDRLATHSALVTGAFVPLFLFLVAFFSALVGLCFVLVRALRGSLSSSRASEDRRSPGPPSSPTWLENLKNLGPNRRHANIYRPLGGGLLGGSGLLCALVLGFEAAVPTSTLLLFWFLLLGVGLAVLIRKAPHEEHQKNHGESSDNVGATSANHAENDSKSHDLYLGYSLFCSGIIALVVVAPAFIFFNGVYDHLTDNLVRAEQWHFANALTHEPECLAALDGTYSATRADCARVFGSKQRERVVHGLPEPRLETAWLRPLPWLFDHMPPLETPEMRGTERLYRANAPPVAANDTVPHDELRHWWRRSDHFLWLDPSEGASGVSQSNMHSEQAAQQPPIHAALPGLIAEAPERLGADVTIVGMLLLILMGGAWFSSINMRRLLFLDVIQKLPLRRVDPRDLHPASSSAGENPSQRRIVVGAGVRLTEALARDRENFEPAPITVPSGPPADHERVWYVTELQDQLTSKSQATRIRELARTGHPLVLLSRVHPVRELQHNECDEDTRQAWLEALEDFDRQFNIEPDSRLDKNETPPTALLHTIWRRLPEDEKRILAQLALDGHASPHRANRRVIRHLVVRGILDPDTLSIRNKKVERFVQRSVTPGELREWTETEKNSIWSALRAPLITGVAVLVVVLSIIRPDLAAASAVAPALASSIPSVWKLLTSLGN